jgi:hypothetical protein
MPIGFAEELEQVRRKSPFWAVIWQVGDAAYYLGIVSACVSPVVIVRVSLDPVDSSAKLLKGIGLFALCLPVSILVCFPAGLGMAIGLRALARRQTGVNRESGSGAPLR